MATPSYYITYPDESIAGNRSKFIIASLQLSVTFDKINNLKNAEMNIRNAVLKGAKIIVLPEMFNCPYNNKYFEQYMETIPDNSNDITEELNPTYYKLSSLAKELGIYIIGGSIPESYNNKIYNTCMIFDKCGKLIAKHRKVHLFDINLPTMVFKESDTLEAGNNITVFETEYCKIGVGICYDMRFSLYGTKMANEGADVLIYPGAFNSVTGPLHWELLQRSRAIDNQVYVVTAAPALDETFSYKSHGHSSIVGPYGNVLATTDTAPDTVMAEINLNWVDEVRKRIPLRSQIRNDLYELK